MNIQTLVYLNIGLTVLLLAGLIILVIKHLRTDRIRREFFASGLKKDLEQILVDQNRGITQLNQNLATLDKDLRQLTAQNRTNIQKIGFLRFNPFDDAGGNISFVLALLNDHDEGVVLSSLHGREATRVYAKAIKNGKGETPLTQEEEQAIKEAN